MCGDWRVQSGVKNEDLTASKQQYKALVWTLAHLQMKYPNIKEIKLHNKKRKNIISPGSQTF